MKKILLALVLAVTVVGGALVARPAYAASCSENKKVQTSILNGDEACTEEGSGIKNLLVLVVDIMTAGVGVLGVVGIVIVGIQYLTASGNEEKTRKAKRRLFEIVLGVAAFVLLAALIKFLVPEASVNN